MNTTIIILNTLLILAIIWVSVAILYLLIDLTTHLITKCRSETRYKKRQREVNEKANEKIEEAKAIKVEETPFSLVGKSRPYIPPVPTNDSLIIPATSSSKKTVENVDTFAPELPDSSGNSANVSEEENELAYGRPLVQIDYSDDMEEVDVEQNEREALLIFDESAISESPHSGGVLVKELARLQQASQKEELDEEEIEAVQETIIKLQGTDLLEQYNKNNAHFELEGKAIMKVIREMEMETKATESQSYSVAEQVSDFSTPDTSEEVEEHPLSYYL